jgi:hypothetical protein
MNNNKLYDDEKILLLLWLFDGHGNLPVQYGVHHPIEAVMGYIRGHWMLPPGKCLHLIAPAAARVINFGTQNGGCNELSWECRMSACRPEHQNNRHILCRQHVGRHVGRHVGDMSKKHVGRGPLMSADM